MAAAVPLKSGESLLSLHSWRGRVLLGFRWRDFSWFAFSRVIGSRCGAARAFTPLLLFLLGWLSGGWCSAQSASSESDDSGSIRGVVINSVTREPIARALVSSPDNRFATLTNSEGRFEFTLEKIGEKTGPASEEENADSNGRGVGDTHIGGPNGGANRPYMLEARKPGFLADRNRQGNNLPNDSSKDLTLELTPEAVIAGTVTLPTSEAPDSISLEIYRRQVQDGRARWVQAGGSRSMSDGQFRFADLPAGSYKLLTNELLDTDPLTSVPHVDPFAPDARGPLFGYPPVYYQSASDFGSASTFQLAAGQTQTINLSLVKQPYYRVKVPVIVPGSDQPDYGLGVTVYAHGHRGPGFSLGYNHLHHAVEGMLPNGTYTVEVTNFRPNGATGVQSITIKGVPGAVSMSEGPAMVLVPNGSIAVNVKEEFTSAGHTGSLTISSNGRASVLNGPRRYLSVTLEAADDFGAGRNVSLRNPTGPSDEALVIEGASAGSYWVRVYSSRGYPASIRSGNLDLQHQPLPVGVGGAASPIEITMRDDMAEISGTVEGITPPLPGFGSAHVDARQSRVHVYCIPLADSSGQFTDVWVHPDGSFESTELAPGAYRVLAFDGVQTEIEYRNPQAMQAYDAKGPVVRVAGGQKERVTLQLISASVASNGQ
jgi:hypothetical protein